MLSRIEKSKMSWQRVQGGVERLRRVDILKGIHLSGRPTQGYTEDMSLLGSVSHAQRACSLTSKTNTKYSHIWSLINSVK